MAALTPGTGATITATTAEGAVFQLLQWWQLQEANSSINPLEQEFFTGNKNTDTNIFEGKWKLQVSISPEGEIITIPLYQNLNFLVGTGGAIVATSGEEYTLKLMIWLINRQKNTSDFNPEKVINITGTLNLNDGIIEGDCKIPFASSLLANGGIQDIAREYLL
jgi:hypothetical protein